MLTNSVKVGNIISSCKKIQKIKDFLSIFTLTKTLRNILFFYDFFNYDLENMLNSNIKKIDFGGKNVLKIHNVSLDQDLDCVVLISTKDSRLADVLYNKILDAVIDRIHPKNTYKDFSNALENINAFISSWMQGKEKISWLHAVLGIYDKKTFLFSTIGRSSCYLYNTHGDVIEVTDKDDSPKDFSFISSWDIADGEILVLSSMRLLDILSKDDVRDGLNYGDIERSAENIEHILLHEHSGKNVGILSLKKQLIVQKESKWKGQVTHYFFRACDNTVAKKGLWYIYHVRDVLLQKSQETKQILIAGGLVVSVFLLYQILSGFFLLASNTQDLEQAKIDFVSAQDYVARASWNMNDVDAFSDNMDSAEQLIASLEEQNVFLWDIEKLKSNISMLKKQFNGIEPFWITPENTIYEFASSMDVVKVVSISNKMYVVHKNSISGPVIQAGEVQNYVFEELSPGDFFVDATVYDTNIVLITNDGKVVNFAKNNRYSYSDVLDQATWEKSPIISSYASNIYMISDSGNQVLRHKKQWNSYEAGVAYLNQDDAASVGSIMSLAIDGGIYILKSDGSVVKLFRSPEYRLEGIVLNKLPENYKFDAEFSHLPSMRARANLKNVYMLYENKILVFKPNTTRYQDVKSLTYVWQIEGRDMRIDDFYVDNDGEIYVASNSWVYKLEFDIIEENLVIK